MSLFRNNTYIDIEYYFLSFLDFNSLKQLFEINKYYNLLLKNYPRIKKYYDFFCINRYRTYDEVVKYDDIDIYQLYDKIYRDFDQTIDVFVKFNALNLLELKFLETFDDDIITTAVKYDNLIVYDKFIQKEDNANGDDLDECIEKDAVNIFIKYFKTDINLMEQMNNIIKKKSIKIFDNLFSENLEQPDIISRIFDLILSLDAIKIFKNIVFNDYLSDIFVELLGKKYANNIINYLNTQHYFNQNNFYKIFNTLASKIKTDNKIGDLTDIYCANDFSYFQTLIEIADKINFDFTQYDLKTLLLNSIDHNNYITIKFIYDSDFNYHRYGFPEPNFDDDIMFRIARKNKLKWISYILLFI